MKVSLILLIALGVAVVLRRRSAAVRHWVLAAAIGCATVMPLMEATVPSWPVPLGSAAVFQPIELDGTAALNPNPAASGVSAFRRTYRAALSDGVRQSTIALSFENLRSLFRPIWIAGVGISVLILLLGLARLAAIAWRSERLTGGRWVELAGEISRAYGLERPLVLLQSTHPTLLVTWGFARPKVLLPLAATTWSDERARVVLSHELAHISRGDWVVYIAAELLRAAYWFNPLTWIVCRRLRLESEHACDDEVMSRGIQGSDYASHLVDLARALNHTRHTWLPAPAMARPSSLERRVRAMLNRQLNRNPLGRSTRAAIVVALLCLSAAIAAAQNVYTTFSGTIMDEQGGRIPDVTLGLLNPQRQAKYEVKSNKAGEFEFVGLPPGDYQLSVVSALGFRKFAENVKIAAPGVRRNVTLQIGSLEESITVRFDPEDKTRASANSGARINEKPMPSAPACVASGEGGRIVPPKKIKDVSPIYPEGMGAAGTEGTVVMEARIGLDGYLTDIRVVGDAHPEFVNATVTAIRDWRFTPTLLNCAPVEPAITVTTRFLKKQ
jgi:TonB family protein